MDPVLLRLRGCRAEFALEGTPSLKGGAALGVLASSILQQGEWSSLPGPALGGHAGLKKPPDTQPNIALPAPSIPGGEHGLLGWGQETQRLWLRRSHRTS